MWLYVYVFMNVFMYVCVFLNFFGDFLHFMA